LEDAVVPFRREVSPGAHSARRPDAGVVARVDPAPVADLAQSPASVTYPSFPPKNLCSMLRRIPLSVCLAVALSGPAFGAAPAWQDVRPLIAETCTDCHNSRKAKGGVDL